jgi:halimadienyl-diphosphate synthase
MNLGQNVDNLLQEIGPGRRISSSAYDTAWVSRLDDLDRPLGEGALEWLRANQLADGSWGASEPVYHHERVACTLSAMTALAKKGLAQDRTRLQRAQVALETHIKGLKADPAGETIAFEMIVPSLLDEAQELGIGQRQNGDLLGRLSRMRAAKLAALPRKTVSRHVTVSFSTEIVGSDGLHLLDAEDLQGDDGSVSCSPSATAFFALHVRPRDSAALEYLHRFAVDGAVPYVAPIGIWERAWGLWNLALAGPLDDKVLSACQPHLDYLEAAWRPGEGVPSADSLTPTDGDATGVTCEVLLQFGRPVDLEAILSFETDTHFRCYELEANPSISTNIHVLGALRQAGLDVQHTSVQKLLRFLRRVRLADMFWLDKWHASPYYTTAHAIIACAGYDDALAASAVAWMLETQRADGSWGYYLSTAEETAYCLQALVVYKRHGGQVPGDVLKRGAAWLADHAEPPYAPLWLGKCLYTPELVVRSAVLSALMLVDQEQS